MKTVQERLQSDMTQITLFIGPMQNGKTTQAANEFAKRLRLKQGNYAVCGFDMAHSAWLLKALFDRPMSPFARDEIANIEWEDERRHAWTCIELKSGTEIHYLSRFHKDDADGCFNGLWCDEECSYAKFIMDILADDPERWLIVSANNKASIVFLDTVLKR